MAIVPTDCDTGADCGKHGMKRNIGLLMLCAATVILGGCNGSISEPWVSGQQAEALEDERTRSAEHKRELERRLQRYASAYR